MSKKWKLSQIIVTIVLVAAVIFCITVIAQVMSRGYVTIAGRSLFRVVTGSMEPTIPTGSLLVSKKIEIEEVERGAIVCFRSKESNMLGQVVTHRVIDIVYSQDGELYLETCGDANPTADGYYVTENNLIGEVTHYTKNGNVMARIFSLITSKIGFLSCIAIPVLAIAGLILKDSLKTIRRELNAISHYMDEEAKKDELQEILSPEEYEELVARLRKELLEEVNNSVEEKTNESESNTGQES